MQLFDSVKMYVFVFCFFVLSTAEKLHQLTKSPAQASAAGFDLKDLVPALITTLITIWLAVRMAELLPKLSNRIEQAAIILFEVLYILWFANLLASFGIVWTEIPHHRFITTAANCAITVLAGVRTFQVVWHIRRT